MGYLLIAISLVICVVLAWNRAKVRGCVFSALERRKQILNWFGVSLLLTVGLVLLFGDSFIIVWLVVSFFTTTVFINLIIRGIWAYNDRKTKN